MRKKEDFSYNSPQEMYQDNKLKKILGPLDYQSAMLEAYMKKINSKNIALELPTGSGKTLIGLLIAEYRRRKNKEKVLFLCPTTQLVNQVVEQATKKYGINVLSFCGKQKEYSQNDKSKFSMAEAVGVTTYSSFFASHSFFDDVDVVIMDDVHSSEDYIISNWTIRINGDEKVLFDRLVSLLRPHISENDYINLLDDRCSLENEIWSDIVPSPIIAEIINEIYTILSSSIESGTSNYYAFNRIRENLQDCNFILSNHCILIRPWIAPTMTHIPFENLKQRVLMSATLGKNGELERITGIEKITRLPIVNDWDKKGIGRKFFVFPDLSFDKSMQWSVVECLQAICKKSVFLVPDRRSREEIKNYFEENLQKIAVYDARDIEKSKSCFIDCEDATVILANRFDGVDFTNDECRLLFIVNLPRTTNAQEKFLIYKMGASKLYEERIRTRIVQAVGRCSRNASDYSIVCILGDTVQNYLTKPDKLNKYSPELRAEIQFGLDNSFECKSIDEIKENAIAFLNRTEEWQMADEHIVSLRNEYCNEEDSIEEVNRRLQETAIEEVKFQYAIWRKDYKNAFEYVSKIIELLNHTKLKGYKSYWQITLGILAYNLNVEGKEEYRLKGCSNIEEAIRNSNGVSWLPRLLEKIYGVISESVTNVDDYFDEIIGGIENTFSKIHSVAKLEERINDILTALNSEDGEKFERGHKELGTLLGYISENPETQGAPDPYWIVKGKLAIVSEDKIYKKKNEAVKAIPICDVRESASHKTWMIERVENLSPSTKIVSIFITTSDTIEEEARMYADDIYYVSRENFVKWATDALSVIRNLWSSFTDLGDFEWREAAHLLFKQRKITPKDYLEFITENKLRDI